MNWYDYKQAMLSGELHDHGDDLVHPCCTQLPRFPKNDDDKGELFNLWWHKFSPILRNYPSSQKFSNFMRKRAKKGGTIGFFSVTFELWTYKFLTDRGMTIELGDEAIMKSKVGQLPPSNDFIVEQNGKTCEIEVCNFMGCELWREIYSYA